MWWIWMGTSAIAGPAVEEVVEVVNLDREVTVKLTYPGREGDPVKVDGWSIGRLPLETRLVEGIHVFEIEGPKGPETVTTKVASESDEPLALDLALAEPAKAAAPTGIQVIGETALRRNADGSIVLQAPPSPKAPPVVETPPAPSPAPQTPDTDR